LTCAWSEKPTPATALKNPPLFMRKDMVERTWRIVQPALDS
jgi:hypothetical protein